MIMASLGRTSMYENSFELILKTIQNLFLVYDIVFTV